jgi:hypothetical protein
MDEAHRKASENQMPSRRLKVEPERGPGVGRGSVRDSMALKELERLAGELEELKGLLKAETRTQARWLILQRVQEIMNRIGEGFKNE